MCTNSGRVHGATWHCRLATSPSPPVGGFWFLVFGYAATQLAIQLHFEFIQVVRINRDAQMRPAESNGIPATDLGFVDISKHRHANKRGTEQNKLEDPN